MRSFTLSRRAETANSTWGELADPRGVPICKILERGAHNPDHPRIPSGRYDVSRKPYGASHFDEAFRALMGARYKGILWLPDVPGRSNIEVHTANRIEELRGCLATGQTIVRDVNKDFAIEGGTSKPAYVSAYLAISDAIDSDGAQLIINDIEV